MLFLNASLFSFKYHQMCYAFYVWSFWVLSSARYSMIITYRKIPTRTVTVSNILKNSPGIKYTSLSQLVLLCIPVAAEPNDTMEI